MILIGQNSLGLGELAQCTSRATDTLTIVRGQEGSTAQTWPVGTAVIQTLTAGNMKNIWNQLSYVSPYNIVGYGADPTGVSDSTTAIQAVFTAIGSSDALIIVPSGSYKVTSQISFSFSASQHVMIEGYGRPVFNSTVAEPGSEAGVFTITSDSGGTGRLLIRNIAISHTAAGNGKVDCLMVQTYNYSGGGTTGLAEVILEDCYFTGGSAEGCNLIGVQSGTVVNCTMSSNHTAGLYITGCSRLTVLGGTYNSNATSPSLGLDYGIAIASSTTLGYSTDISIIGTHCNNNGRKGIDCHHGHRILMEGNTCNGNGITGLYAVCTSSSVDCADISIIGNSIDMTSATGLVTAIEVGTFGTTGALTAGTFVVANNRISNVDQNANTGNVAIQIDSATTGIAPKRVAVTGNVVQNGSGSAAQIINVSGTLAIGALLIADNVLHGVTCASAIVVGSGATDVSVTGNMIHVDTTITSYGITLSSTTANAIVMGNQITGAAPGTSPINMTGSPQLNQNNTVNGTLVPPLTTNTSHPTLTSVNANVISTSVNGSDSAMTITWTVTTGTITANTNLFTVNFAHAYTASPAVVITSNSNNTGSAFYASSTGTGTFTVACGGPCTVSSGYGLGIMVMGV